MQMLLFWFQGQLCCLLMGIALSLYLVSLFSPTSFGGFLFPAVKGHVGIPLSLSYDQVKKASTWLADIK